MTKKKLPRVLLKLSPKERAWCIKHAKEHAIEALSEEAAEEHHSFVKVDDKVRSDMTEAVVWHLVRMMKNVRRERVRDWT